MAKSRSRIQRAIQLDPNDAAIRSSYGMFLVTMNKLDSGIGEMRLALQLDPVSDRTNLNYTWALFMAHRFDEAIAQANHALSLSVAYGQFYLLGEC